MVLHSLDAAMTDVIEDSGYNIKERRIFTDHLRSCFKSFTTILRDVPLEQR